MKGFFGKDKGGTVIIEKLENRKETGIREGGIVEEVYYKEG